MGREHQGKGRARAKGESCGELPRGPHTLSPGCSPESCHNHQFHQVTPSLEHLLRFSIALHIRCSSLTNQMPPLAPHHCPTIMTVPINPCTSWTVLCHVGGHLLSPGLAHTPICRGKWPHCPSPSPPPRRPVTTAVLPMRGADPHGCSPTRHSLRLLFQGWGWD